MTNIETPAIDSVFLRVPLSTVGARAQQRLSSRRGVLGPGFPARCPHPGIPGNRASNSPRSPAILVQTSRLGVPRYGVHGPRTAGRFSRRGRVSRSGAPPSRHPPGAARRPAQVSASPRGGSEASVTARAAPRRVPGHRVPPTPVSGHPGMNRLYKRACALVTGDCDL